MGCRAARENIEHGEHHCCLALPADDLLLLLYTGLRCIHIRLAVKRHNVGEPLQLQRQHRIREPLLWHADDDCSRPVEPPPDLDHRDRDAQRLENLLDARETLLRPFDLDENEGVHLLPFVCQRFFPLTGEGRT